MEYVTKSCPHCGYNYSIHEPKGSGFYGSKIRTCQRCGKQFIDKEYREIAIEGIREVDEHRISPATLFSALFFIAFACALVWLFFNDLSLFSSGRTFFSLIGAAISAGIGVFLVVSESNEYGERQEYLKQEKINSEKRMQNPQYINLLKELGYEISEKYLKKEYDE